MKRYRLVLTNEADRDLNNLYLEGFEKWGEAQADKYYFALLEHFELLCENPYLFQAIDDIRLGYRRSVCQKHSIFYRVVNATIEIAALVKYEDRK
ncbi:type II toxin-antitoxin system RelE/ParE family toxin [Alteromonas mediterranea]|uniref:type II toxin-antitoxin system RelE/ParE family toxin n=1 Tax=Alteromonas mediterranea TaxID=314275 RepID=UPI0015E8616E|nr:type II toxin-antitoxin system RelE/ParE family toxin [Alteromonas mediterranea]